MRPRSRVLLLSGCLIATFAVAGVPLHSAADPEAAERQYRVARRLAAEGSPEAAAALRRVVELDPAGPLADDAMLDEALLLGVPRWPEELDRQGPQDVVAAAELLDELLEHFPRADRSIDALFYRALLRLEPGPGYDASAARVELIEIAGRREAAEWATNARYVRAWLDEQQGRHDRANAAYQRVVLDAPGSPAGSRACVGLGRVLLGEGHYAEAARWLQQAIERGALREPVAEPLRELAVRLLLGGPVPGSASRVVVSTGMKTLAGMAATPDGGALIGERRSGSVQRLDSGGTLRDEWTVPKLQALAVGPSNVGYAVGAGGLYRLLPGRDAEPLATLGEYAQTPALAVDGLGGVWLLDRRGSRIGRLEPDRGEVTTFWEEEGVRLDSLLWDGRRLLTIDTKGRAVRVVERDGSSRLAGPGREQKPDALAVDPAGRVAVLDAKIGQLYWIGPAGRGAGSFSTSSVGIDRPGPIGVGPDGALLLFDQSNGSWVRLP